MILDDNHIKKTLLAFEANRWVGVIEENSNQGQLIKIFQKSVDGKASQEPWCMAFAQYCIQMVDDAFAALFPGNPTEKSGIFRGEHCLTVWNKSKHLQSSTPSPGSLCIWQKYNGLEASSSGHVGIVTEVHADDTVSVVEGNTSNGKNGLIEREGDGVFLKRYSVKNMNRGALKLKGYLSVW